MRIGLFFGSFNPVHTGHLIMASTILNEFPLARIWFVVSPQNPLKQNTSLLEAEKRLMLVEKAIINDPRFETSNIEFELPQPSYTIDTLYNFEKQYPEHHFYLIMGSDSFLQLKRWKSYEALIKKDIIVYQRPGFLIPDDLSCPNIVFVKSSLLDISATEIRALIRSGKSIKYLVPGIVEQLIDSQSLYK
jgi:nicotinate-nucleotide adenylyltransferase